MKLERWVMVAALAALGSIGAKADGIPTGTHYLIDLEDWDLGQDFFVTINPTVPVVISPCLPAGDVCGDPSVRINQGGGSTPEEGDYNFMSPSVGNCGADNSLACFISDFQNTGPNDTTLELTVELNNDQLVPPLNNFECSGGDLFNTCGFTLTDPPPPSGTSLSGIDLHAYFYNVETPEPSQWAVLLLGCAALIVARKRQRSH